MLAVEQKHFEFSPNELAFYIDKVRMAWRTTQVDNEKRLKVLRKVFKDHTDFVQAAIKLLDNVMKTQPEGEARGRRIADLINKLEMKNDSVRRFVLDLDFNGRPLKRNR
jgi:hypothetical protein